MYSDLNLFLKLVSRFYIVRFKVQSEQIYKSIIAENQVHQTHTTYLK